MVTLNRTHSKLVSSYGNKYSAEKEDMVTLNRTHSKLVPSYVHGKTSNKLGHSKFGMICGVLSHMDRLRITVHVATCISACRSIVWYL